MLVAHMGLTTGKLSAPKRHCSTTVSAVSAIAAAGRSVRKDVIVLCHGGPIAMPNDAQYVLSRCDIHGFYGRELHVRLPTEVAIKQQVAEFTKLTLAWN
ncbi:MAG: phosphoenolpyruvate hydrolase family protein [Planctomycetaceae bacterium]